ncbi:glycosyltransferase family 4 protein [Micromonospora sp. STR1_7]|uniref:Glycosyltransferase family 4 protein n=1 Tax=Micromonospora parastrephiae TaxID=2806101 RepID=A0ABS1XW49_9ACTN|nr:glycosyltransferase family 4 protein [Micromonospora parastrephiae]MBM0233463.1 glycosyltransferase family 4 protein [Micromonospora parastrephiae]
MRIGLISQWYPPESTFVPGQLATELARRGHEVRVLTTFPSLPLGRTYPGWRQRWNHRAADRGVTVRRVPAYPSHDRSGLRRAASYLSFAATSTLAAPRHLRGADALYVYHPPPTSYAAAGLLRLLRGVPTVLHVQDLWPESVTASGMAPSGLAGRALDGVLAATMRRIYRSCAGIAVIAPAMAEQVIERGVDPGAVRTVFNWTDEALFRPLEATEAGRTAIGHRGRTTVMFAGNLGLLQGVDVAIRAAAAVPDAVDLVFVGTGVGAEQARQLAAELGAANVRFLGQRPAAEMAELYAAADYQLVMLRDLPWLRGTVPSKLQAALACGVPVLMSADGDAAGLVTAGGAGLVCPPDDWRALADQFVAAARVPTDERLAMGRQGRQLYLDRMSLRVGVDQIEDLLAKATAHGRH